MAFKFPERKYLIGSFLALAVIFLTFAFFLDRIIKENNLGFGQGGGTETMIDEDSQPEAPATRAFLSLEPSDEVFGIDEVKVMELKVRFEGSTPGDKLDYFNTEVSFPKDYLKIPAEAYIDTSASGLGKVFRVDGPAAANESGKIVIELGAEAKDSGPSAEEPLTVAKIYFQGIAESEGPQTFFFGETQIVDNRSNDLGVENQDTGFSVSSEMQ